jgi:hypothetical protein
VLTGLTDVVPSTFADVRRIEDYALHGDLQTAALIDRSGHRRSRLRSGLVIGQVLLCTVLVAGSMLFLRSLANAKAIDPDLVQALTAGWIACSVEICAIKE